MYKFARIFAIDLLNLFTNPMWMAYAIAFPIALILILGFLGSGSYGSAVTSYDYYGVAMMVYGIFNAATFSANSFMEERIKSPNMRIVYSPVRLWYIHFSKVLATTVFCSATYFSVATFMHFVVGVNYGGADFWALVIIALLSIFFFSALGVLFCCMLKSEGAANNVLSLLINIFAVLGGIFFPIDALGKALSTASWISPAKWILAAWLQIIYDGDFKMFLPACAALALLSVAFVFLSAKLFRGEEYI